MRARRYRRRKWVRPVLGEGSRPLWANPVSARGCRGMGIRLAPSYKLVVVSCLLSRHGRSHFIAWRYFTGRVQRGPGGIDRLSPAIPYPRTAFFVALTAIGYP